MRNLIGKIALTTGSALVAGALLIIAYLAAGTFILAGFLSAVFLVGEKTDVVQYVFAPIAFSAVLIFAAASWGLWRARRRRVVALEAEAPGRRRWSGGTFALTVAAQKFSSKSSG